MPQTKIIEYDKKSGKYEIFNTLIARKLKLPKDIITDDYFTFDDSKLESIAYLAEEETFKRLQKRAKNRRWSRAVAPLKPVDIVQPHNTEYVFEPYQEVGIHWICQKKATMLADEMGVGKTAQFIGACNKLNSKKILIVCPATLKINWEREFDKFGSNPDLTTQIINGKKDIDYLKENGQPNILIINYDLIIREPYKDAIESLEYDIAAYDESHALKSVLAMRTWAVLGNEDNKGLVGLAERNVFISGTPYLNHALDAYPILYTVAKFAIKPYRSYAAFRNNFTNWRYHQEREIVMNSKNEDLLNNMLRSTVMVRRTKDQVFSKYKKPEINIVPIELEGEIRNRFVKEYKKDKKEKSVKELISDVGELGTLSRERSLLSRAKVPKTIEYIKMLRDGGVDKIVIFGHHKETLKSLQAGLKKLNPVIITGDTKAFDRQKAIDSFQNDPKCKIFIGNIQAAGTGITLTAAHHVVFIETNWSPSEVYQAIARLDRKGQTEWVIAHILTVKGSNDDRTSSTIYRKDKEISKIVA